MNTTSIVTNILFIEKDSGAVENFRKTLRKADLTVNLTATGSASKAEQTLKNSNIDLVVINLSQDVIDIKKVRNALTNAKLDNVFIIALTSEEDSKNPIQHLADGAKFVVADNNEDWMVYCLKEAHRIHQFTKEHNYFKAQVDELKSRSSNLLEEASEPIAYLVDGAHIYANPAYLELFGFTDFNELASYTILDLISSEDQKTFKTDLKQAKRLKEPKEFQLTGVNPSTEASFELKFELQNTSYQNNPCQQLRVIINKPEISSLLSNANGELFSSNGRQVLVKNNSELILHFFNQIRSQEPKSAWLILLVLDELPEIWALKGIEAVAQWMQSISNAIEELLGEDAMLLEYTNNSIMILVQGCNIQESDRLTNTLRTMCEEHSIEIEGENFSTTCHAQSIALGHDIEKLPEILKKLDRQSGMLSHIVINDNGDVEQAEAGSIEALFQSLEIALTEKRCKPIFAPVASFSDLSIDHYWLNFTVIDQENNEKEWNRTPLEVQMHPVLTNLDQWLVTQAVQHLVKSAKEQSKTKNVSIPLSANASQDHNFVTWLSAVLKKTKLAPSTLSFGFSEEILLEYNKESISLLQKLNQLGCSTFIYNFTTEHMNLADRSNIRYAYVSSRFINRISRTRDTELKTQARTSFTLLQQKEIKTIACGVDAAPQMATVWEYTFDFAQGVMVSEPLEQMDFDFDAFAVSF